MLCPGCGHENEPSHRFYSLSAELLFDLDGTLDLKGKESQVVARVLRASPATG